MMIARYSKVSMSTEYLDTARYSVSFDADHSLKALCNEFFDGEIFELRYSVLCTGSKDANRFPKLQVALFL